MKKHSNLLLTILLPFFVVFLGCNDVKTGKKIIEKQLKRAAKIDEPKKREKAIQLLNEEAKLFDSSYAHSLRTQKEFIELDHDFDITRDSLKSHIDKVYKERIAFITTSIKLRNELKLLVGENEWKNYSNNYRVRNKK